MAIQSNFPAIKPSLLLDFANTKQLDPRITFTRASTATYYDGVTTSKAEENQLTYSNEISTARWVGAGVSTTINNSTSPDGTTTATLLTASAGADSRIRLTTTQAVSTTHTYSVYAKAGASSWLRLRNIGSNDCSGWFNLTTGVVGTVSGGTSAITSVGSGWYRCSITSTSAASIANNLLDMGAPSGDNTQASAGGETISVWGVQLEARSSVSALTVTTTQAITNYIPKLQSAASGVARFDNNPTTGESLGLLIEESRTNLVLRSDDYANASWTKTNASIDSNTIVAPDGTLTGDKLVEDTSTGVHTAQQGGITTSASTTYTVTTYAKAAGRDWLFILDNNNPSAVQAYFNVSTGALGTIGGSATATITSVGNSWYRCSVTFATGPSQSSINLLLRTASANGTTSYTGNGFSGIFIWGTQVEAGAFATSYIPTVASQVTRAADAASMTGTNFSTWYSTQQGTLYANAVSNGDKGAYQFAMELTNSTRGDAFAIAKDTSNLVRYQALGLTGTAFNSTDGTWTTGSDFKVALAMSNGSSAGDKNGGTVVSGSAPTVLPIPTQMGIGCASNGSSNYWNGTIKKIAYYPMRVTNANLQALTS